MTEDEAAKPEIPMWIERAARAIGELPMGIIGENFVQVCIGIIRRESPESDRVTPPADLAEAMVAAAEQCGDDGHVAMWVTKHDGDPPCAMLVKANHHVRVAIHSQAEVIVDSVTLDKMPAAILAAVRPEDAPTEPDDSERIRNAAPYPIDVAKRLRVCRICGRRDNATTREDGSTNPFMLEYGKEYAHKDCLAACRTPTREEAIADLRAGKMEVALRYLEQEQST